MAMGSAGGIRAAVAEINVTPLIDVLLVLLIIFMVIVPVTPKGLEALVPQPPKSPDVESPPQTIVVEVTSSRTGLPAYKIDGEALAKPAIEPRLAAIFASRAEKVMFVRGDAGLQYESIAEVIDFAHQAGVDNVGILTPGTLAGQ